MRKFKLLSAVALAGLLLAALTGCEKKTPSGGAAGDTSATQPTGAPAGESKPAALGAALKIPAPAPLVNPDVFVMARLRDPNKLLDRLGEWVATVQPAMNAEMLRNQVAMMGLDLKELPAGEALAAFLLAPAGTSQEPVWLSLLPLGSASQTIAALRPRLGSDGITTVGQYTLLHMDSPVAAERARKEAPGLIELNKAPALSDIQAYVNVAGVMEKFGPLLTQKIQAAQMFLTAMSAQAQQGSPEQMAGLQKILGAEIQGLLDALNQMQFLNLGLDLGADRLDLALIAKGKPGSGLEKALSKPAPPELDLTAYLIPEAIARGQMTMRDLQSIVDVYLKYMQLMLGPGQEAALAKLKADLSDLAKLGTLHYGFAFDISPEGKLVYEIAIKCDNNDAFMDLVRKKVTDLIEAGALHDLYKQFGMDAKMTAAPQTRKAGDIEVTQFSMSIDMTTATAPQQRAVLEKLMGKMNIEMAKVGDCVALTLGEPIDALAKRIQAKQAGPPLASKQAYPAGGVFYLDLSIAGWLKVMKSAMPPEQAGMLPTIPAGAPPLTFAGYHADGMAWYRFGLSRELLKSLVPQPPGPTPASPVIPNPTR